MKKIVLSLAAFASLSMVGMLFFNEGTVYSNGTGAPAASACTACHGGSVNTSDNLSIVLKDGGNTVTSYEAGKAYDITVTFTGTSSTKVGFALSVNVGTLTVKGGDNSYQKFGTYLTHTFGGTAVTGGEVSWTGTWTAPASSSNTANFQVYINETNANNAESGDVIYGKSASVPKLTTGVNDIAGVVSYEIYPNPVSDVLTVSANMKQSANLGIAVYSLDGKLVNTLHNGTEAAGAVVKHFPVGDMSKGIYLLEVKANDQRSVQKIVIN
jgi:hypothetical protein